MDLNGKEWCREHPKECGIDLEEICKNYCEENSESYVTNTSALEENTTSSSSEEDKGTTINVGSCTIGTAGGIDLSFIGLILGGGIYLLRGRRNKNS